MLFDRGRGELALQLLDEGRDVEGLHLRELVQAVRLAPLRKPPRGVQVGFARVVVIDLGGEEFQLALRRFGVGANRRAGTRPGAGERTRAVLMTVVAPVGDGFSRTRALLK